MKRSSQSMSDQDQETSPAKTKIGRIDASPTKRELGHLNENRHGFSEIREFGSHHAQSRPLTNRSLRDGVFWTRIECLSDAPNVDALSLRELFQAVEPVASIHFNFCVDPEWVLKQYPRRCRGGSVTFVVGADDARDLGAQCAEFGSDLVSVHGAPLLFPFGTHHTKLSLFESESALHVCVMTANLVPQDWALKTQALFYCKGMFDRSGGERDVNEATEAKIKEAGHGSIESAEASSSAVTHISEFASDLVDYLRSAYCRPGCSQGLRDAVGYWLGRIEQGKAMFRLPFGARLVSSAPGRFTKSEMARFGHLRLRALLSEHFTPEQLQLQGLKLAQFSSIGSLGPHAESWLCNEFLSSLGGTRQLLPASQLRLVYPCLDDVINSLEGLDAGLSLPYQSKTHAKQRYILRFLNKWRSEKLSRTNAMPHVKSYAGVEHPKSAKTVDDFHIKWLLFTSANLSKSAWGCLEKAGSQLFVRSYELGVLLFPDSKLPKNDVKDGSKNCLSTSFASPSLQLPFDLPLTRYENGTGEGNAAKVDEPFQVDIHYR